MEGPILNRRRGALVLSRNAGAYGRIGRHALGVNPFDVDETAGAIADALDDARRRAGAPRARSPAGRAGQHAGEVAACAAGRPRAVARPRPGARRAGPEARPDPRDRRPSTSAASTSAAGVSSPRTATFTVTRPRSPSRSSAANASRSATSSPAYSTASRPASPAIALPHRTALHRVVGGHDLEDHLPLDDGHAGCGRHRLEAGHQRRASTRRIRRLPVVHGHRDTLVLDPGLGDGGGGALDLGQDREQELRRRVLEAVQPLVPDAGHGDQLGHLLGAPAGHDGDDGVAAGQCGEGLADALGRCCELGPGDDRRQRTVEVQQDPRSCRALTERVDHAGVVVVADHDDDLDALVDEVRPASPPDELLDLGVLEVCVGARPVAFDSFCSASAPPTK